MATVDEVTDAVVEGGGSNMLGEKFRVMMFK